MIVLAPALDADALAAMLDTLSQDLWSGLLIVDNSVDGIGPHWPGLVYRPEPHGHARSYEPRCNIGVSRSINLAARGLRSGGESLMWVSTSMRFADDGGMCLVEESQRHTYGLIGLPAQMHAFVMHAAAFDVVGLWDENFYPGYYEDTDWRRRLDLTVGGLPVADLPGAHIRDGRGYDALRAHNPGRTVINFDALKAYYSAKWGGLPGAERFERPFGCRPIDHWNPVTREELIDAYGLGLG